MEKLLVLSVLAEVLLISVILVIMGRRRFSAAKNKEISVGAFRTMDLAGANESVITASRNFENQFQMPMLFMFGVLFVLQFQLADLVFVLLAALYVAFGALAHRGGGFANCGCDLGGGHACYTRCHGLPAH